MAAAAVALVVAAAAVALEVAAAAVALVVVVAHRQAPHPPTCSHTL